MTRSKVAAKYVNLVDRVVEVRHDPRPPYTIISKVGEDIDLGVFHPTRWSGMKWPEWDESTLGDLVATGLRGQ